jgi:hypothetical protein
MSFSRLQLQGRQTLLYLSPANQCEGQSQYLLWPGVPWPLAGLPAALEAAVPRAQAALAAAARAGVPPVVLARWGWGTYVHALNRVSPWVLRDLLRRMRVAWVQASGRKHLGCSDTFVFDQHH